MIFDKFQVQFRIRIHNLELRIRILQKSFGSLRIQIRIHNTAVEWPGFVRLITEEWTDP
jgi:hypothetical protein